MGNGGDDLRNLLLSDATIVGTNIQYDIGWLEYELGIQGKTKATLLDIQFAEALIDEYGEYNLDYLSHKYLGVGKRKSALEAWAASNLLKGDFRKYIKDAPENLVREYVEADAEYPVLIYRKQEAILKREELMEPFLTDCELIKVVLGMKRRGVRIDEEKRKSNRQVLENAIKEKEEKLQRIYGKLNVNSTKQLASAFTRQNIPYNYKIVIKGRNTTFYSWGNFSDGLNEVSDYVPGFRRVKNKIQLVVENKKAPSVESTLRANGFVFTSNPTIDKKSLAALAEQYEFVRLVEDIKKGRGIISKFLGDEFTRFIANDGKIHPDFNIAKSDEYGTISGRFSASNPNAQQIPSKGSITTEAGEEINLAKLCREVFIPDDGCLFFKIDYSQIEYRLLVHYAVGPGAKEARQEFNENPETDYHKFVMDLTGLERKYAKNCNFGIMYGMGIQSMMANFGWSKDFAEQVMDTYRDAVPYVFTTMKKVQDMAIEREKTVMVNGQQIKQSGYIKTIGGRHARLKSKDFAYAMLNRLNQGSAADIMKRAMVLAHREGLGERLNIAITVHDELDGSVPITPEGLKDLKRLQEIMTTCYTLKVPLLADPEVGKNWFDVKELDDDLFNS
jgi:DNA polymerase-1